MILHTDELKKLPDKPHFSSILFEFLETVYSFQKKEELLYNITWQDIYLLQKLNKKGPQPVSALGEMLCVPLFNISRIISRLQEKEFVVKKRLSDDRRTVLVSLAPAGIDVLKRIEDYHYELITRNITVFSLEETASLIEALPKLPQLLELV